MKKFIFTLLLVPMLLGTNVAQAAKCKYEKSKRDPVTNQKIIQTKWDRVTNVMMDLHAQALVSGVAIADQRYLDLKLNTTDYYAAPAWYYERYKTKAEKKQYEARLKEHTKKLASESVAIPAGSVLRIAMEDRSVIELTTSSDVRATGGVTMPNKEYKRKGFGGLLKKVAAAEAGADKVISPHFRVDAEFVVRYELDEETLAILGNKPALNMRVESRDDYYYLGARDTTQNLAWGNGAKDNIQNALACASSKT